MLLSRECCCQYYSKSCSVFPGEIYRPYWAWERVKDIENISEQTYCERPAYLVQMRLWYTNNFNWLPWLVCRSILTVPWIEIGGKTNITCAKTGYQATVQFHCRVGDLFALKAQATHATKTSFSPLIPSLMLLAWNMEVTKVVEPRFLTVYFF